MTRVLVLRHGQSEWNAAGRWQGWADPPLTPLGEAQARAAAGRLPPVDAIVASDLVRALRTAELIAGALDIASVERVPALRERDIGPWSGLTTEEIERGWPGFLRDRREPDGAEPARHFAQRVVTALHDLAARHPDREVLAVAHGGVIRALERHLAVEPVAIANLAGRWFTITDRKILADHGVQPIDSDIVAGTNPFTQ